MIFGRSLLLPAGILLLILDVVRGETCLNEGQLAGLVFGTSFATLLLSLAVALLLWCFVRNRKTEESIIVLEKAPEKGAYENGALEMENKATEPMPTPHADKMTSCHSLKQKHRRKLLETMHAQQTQSTDSYSNLEEMVRSMLEARDLSPLGFNIREENEGIFINCVHPESPAERCGNIFSGDKIKALTVSFEGILLEDAIGILSCAAPYKVKLELERALSEDDQKAGDGFEMEQESDRRSEISPHLAFRSISLNSLSSNASSEKKKRGGSFMSKQKYALPRERRSLSSPPARSECMQDESIQYSSPTPSYPPESIGTESSSTLAISSVCEKTPSPSPTPPPVPPPVQQLHPQPPVSVQEVHREGITELTEVSRYCYAKPSLIPKRVKRVEFCARIEPKRKSVVVEFKENEPIKDETSGKLKPKGDSLKRPPHIEAVKVEKFEKVESPVVTPVIERKLPPLPKMIERRDEEAKNGAPLYIEQKEALRKTYVPQPKSEPVALARDQRARLDANRSLLQRQQEELRALGILP